MVLYPCFLCKGYLLIDSSHCDTCKLLSGAPYTLNQIIPAKALNVTKGKDLGKYTYKGDSGKGVHCVSKVFIQFFCFSSNILT
jgi:hypothetical protein